MIERATHQRVPTTSEFERMLRGVSLRVTRPRVAVLAAVHDRPHVDTDTIIGAVREDLGKVSHQAVYDVLRALNRLVPGAAHPALGLAIDEAEVIYWGRCPECAAAMSGLGIALSED
jgi:Fe2+ or Zn2+ uptake regulation protein